MPQSKFLEQIADYYTSAERVKHLPDITFIFPNKRSAMFLKRYIQQRVTGNFSFMPRFTTFRRFAAQTVRVAEASRFESLFMLYNAYRQALLEKGAEGKNQVRDFDKFIFWGDMILSDFDEIDRSLADASKLYANLDEFHELTADYLTDEQKEVIRRIWGETNLTFHIDRFWHHFDPHADSENAITQKFITLWNILPRIYELFRQKLVENDLTTAGMQMREACVKIKNSGKSDFGRRRFVFVGLSELSNAEISIMGRLHQLGLAEFFWDLESPLFKTQDGKLSTSNTAVNFILKLSKEFPKPADFTFKPVEMNGYIDIIGIPSSVGQAKYAGRIVEQLQQAGKIQKDNAIETAIVLPQPSQLMPLLLGLPEDAPGINITMGLPYSSTTFATLFGAIIAMQRRQRKRRGGIRTFFFQDILEVLVHPHLQLLAPKRANTIRQYIYDQGLYNIDADKLRTEFPELDFIFRPIENQEDLDETYHYVEDLVIGIHQALQKTVGENNFKNSFELGILKFLEKQITELKQLMEKYHIEMQEITFLMLFERILRAMTINVEGTPLQGLQVMGVLETRSLDFDNLVFLAMNERCFPRRDYVKTMIPNNLRRGYGLPSIERSESFYSYHFLRAIGRASTVTLLYDTRPPGRGAGEMSRYLAQLLYLYPQSNVNHYIMELGGVQPTSRIISINKTEEVINQLNAFRSPGGPKISASALKTYMKCPLRFYLQYVNGLRDEDTPLDYVDAAKLGDIFHHTAKRLYEPYKNEVINREILYKMQQPEVLEPIMLEEVAMAQGINPEGVTIDDLNSEGRLILSHTAAQIRNMLCVEALTYCPHDSEFIYIAGEKDVVKPWTVMPGLTVNFRMQIDRIDQINSDTLRFIDYKTGSDDYKVGNELEDLFGDNHKKDAIFQLLVYAEAYHDLVNPHVRIRPALHIVKDIMSEGKINPITYKKSAMPDFPALSAEFRPLLNKLFFEIFDPEMPFDQCENSDNCRFCPFVSMCGRNLPPERY